VGCLRRRWLGLRWPAALLGRGRMRGWPGYVGGRV